MERLRTPEIPENLNFISVEDIEQMRREQEEFILRTTSEAIASLDISEVLTDGARMRQEAADSANDELDALAEQYVANHINRDDNEELFDGCVDLVRRFSVQNMDDEKWRAGDKDADGNYITGTSGQSELFSELEALTEAPAEPVPPVVDVLHDNAEIARLTGNLESTRSALAAISIQRRALLSKGKSKKAKSLREQYDTALAAYNQAQMEIGAVSVDSLRATGMNDDEIKVRVVAGTLAERAAFTQAEADAMAEDNSRMGRFVRWYSKTTKRMVGINVAAGLGAGYALGKFAKFGLLAAVPGLGFGVLAGARAGKAMLTASVAGRARLHREFERRGAADEAELREQLIEQSRGMSGSDTSELATFAARNVQNSVDGRIDKDVNGNVKRVALSAAVTGSAALVGALAADHIHWPGSGSGSKEVMPTSALYEAAQEANAAEAARQQILDNPEAFERMINDPDKFQTFLDGVETIEKDSGLSGDALRERVYNTLALADQLENTTPSSGGIDLQIDPSDLDILTSSSEVYSIPYGGGIIDNVIRPMASEQGYTLSGSQETEVWQAVRAKFGNDLFADLPVGARGADQWILQPGRGELKPEVAKYLAEQIAAIR